MEIGVAYYPEHWPSERWADDFALMAKAGITLVRMGEYAWCRLEPREGEYDFGWLDRAVSLAGEHGIKALLCTPTQGPPPWLSVNYPETRPWTAKGLPYALGSRRHVDAASPAFQHFSDTIVHQLGEHYGHNPNVAGWQLDNEIGAHTHFVSTSPWAQAKFREWLRKRYGTVEALNEAWGLIFWSGEVREWSEIEIQTETPVSKNPAYRKELRDFGQELWMDFLQRQTEILRPLCPEQFITHNIAWYGEQIDVWRLHEFLDVVGIDIYQNRPELISAVDDLYDAAARGKSWAVLEMPAREGTYQTEREAGFREGELTATLVKHALAGAKFASMFRFQPSPAGCELFGGPGLRDEASRPTATVEAVSAAKRIIDRLQPVLAQPRTADIAIIQDTDDLIFSEMNVIEGGRSRHMFNDYPRELQEIHHQLAKRGHRPTFASLADDLSRFRLVILWDKLMIRPEQVEAIRRYVAGGGTLVANYCLGYLNGAGRRTAAPLPYGLTDVFGCTVRDHLRVRPDMAPRLRVGDQLTEAENLLVTLEPLGGEVRATWEGWTGDYRAAVVTNQFGPGKTLYIGALLGRAGWDVLMPLVMDYAGLPIVRPIAPQPQLECVPERGCWVVFNTGHEPVTTDVTGNFRDLVGERDIVDTLSLPGYGIAVLQPM